VSTIQQARWVKCSDEKMLSDFKAKLTNNLSIDHAGELVYLAPTRINLQMTQERWPEVEFLETREQVFN
jgi:peptide chain release factor 3